MAVGIGIAPARAPAQALAAQPVKLLVPIPPGGTSDLVARLVAEPLSRGVRQAVIVENRSGASGRIAAEALRKAKPDGSTLLLAPVIVPVLLPLLHPDFRFEPVRDFVPVAQVGTYTFAVAVRPDHPARTLRELVAWLEAHPAQANFGTAGAGSMPHFVGSLLAQSSGVPMQHVAYRGVGQVMEQVMAGDLALGIGATSDLLEMHRAGKLRIVATSGDFRVTQLASVPTFREQGYAISAAGWTGLFAPAGTPRAMIDALSEAVVAAIGLREVREGLLALGVEPTGTTPEAFASIIKADVARWAPAVKASGFTPE